MNIDSTIQLLFAKLEARKQAIAALKVNIARSWKTNGSFRLIGAPTPTNIQTAPLDIVEEIASHICLLETARQQVADRLGRPVSKTMQGNPISDWFDDLNKRIATISVREEERELADLEARLNQVLSPDERRRIEVEMLLKAI